MAIKGVSLAEKEPYILKADPAHPDNIKLAVDTRIANMKGEPTDEIRAKLEAAAKEKAGEPTIFYLGVLTKADRVEIGDMTTIPTMKDGGITLDGKRQRKYYATVQRGLRGWENMQDSDGKIVAFTAGTVQRSDGSFAPAAEDKCLLHLDANAVAELAGAILEKNGMRSSVEKNFEAASQLLEGGTFESGDAIPAPQTNSESEDALPLPSSDEAASEPQS